MWKKVQQFLQKYGVTEGPLLLGYSGGVDSASLFHLLQKCGVDIHVIHVNHGWRETSLKEAEMLKEYVETHNIPFYLETIDAIDPRHEKNLEDRYRQERFKLFQKHYHKIGAKALFLGHQKDDQAETIFKRIFEGASLGKLVGLKECSEMQGMKILRPLLSFTKQELYELALLEGFHFIEDETNENVYYLRARQRVEIFPEIEKKFGKNATDNLCRFSHNLSRYETYMERKMERYQRESRKGPFGIYLNLKHLYPLEELELEYYIRKVCAEYGSALSHDALSMVLLKIQEQAANKKVILHNLELIIDRDYLFFFRPLKDQEKITECIDISTLPQLFEYQGIQWKLDQVDAVHFEASWHNLWSGTIDFVGSDEMFQLSASNLSHRLGRKSLKNIYAEQKVPAFLRGRFPHIMQKNQLRSDLLIPIYPQELKGHKFFRLSVIALI